MGDDFSKRDDRKDKNNKFCDQNYVKRLILNPKTPKILNEDYLRKFSIFVKKNQKLS